MSFDLEQKLCKALRDHPYKFSNRYDHKARLALLDTLFRALTNDRTDYLLGLFPSGFPDSYTLKDAQGTAENAEYTEAARGHRCGHIFRHGEAAYHCMTCAGDPTCVLCSRCFDASDHEGHHFHISASLGNSGCCDCGDLEAWKRRVNCAIHTSSEGTNTHQPSSLPLDLVDAIKTTIGRALDYFCDILSCSPEQLRLPKTEANIKDDERSSRLGSRWYGDADAFDENPEYCLMVWNDEKHTEMEVSDAIKRACRQTSRFGNAKAREANDIGRSILRHSTNLGELIRVSGIIESIQVTTTIRTSRDTFREQMCGTIIEWLSDIAGCAVGDDHHILRHTICTEMLQRWRVGSEAYNAQIGRRGIDDHEYTENTHRFVTHSDLLRRPIPPVVIGLVVDNDDEMRDPDRDTEADPMEVEDTLETVDERDAQAGQGTLLTQRMDLLRMTRNPDGNGPLLPVVNDDIDVEQGHDASEEDVDPATDSNFDLHPRTGVFTPTGSDSADEGTMPAGYMANYRTVPRTPYGRRKLLNGVQPSHWAIEPFGAKHRGDLPSHEDLSESIRLDFMIMFDMRMWKKARIDLRDLYISTVVNVPDFKRILGLRFSGLYTLISQLYLIADREPDHSIINLSLQMLTSTSITEEVIQRGNFLTNLMAIIYTFLTSRQVGFPEDVSSSASLAFDTGSVTNRRLYHFFSDLRYFLSSEAVQRKVAEEEQYLMQFIDLVKLSQGICPNVRAVGEHVEYETDAWIGASILTREINKICRQFSEAFSSNKAKANGSDIITRAIYTSAIATIYHSTGMELKRFDQSEIRNPTNFKDVKPFELEYIVHRGPTKPHRVVDYVVEKGALSFHHALHYTFSWLVEGGKSLSNAELRAALYKAGSDYFTQHGPLESSPRNVGDAEDAVLALFDYPLRVCAWLAQMRAGLWVRNGMSLRHQMLQYRAVTFRDVGYHRDIFLLQTALVACDPSRVLATMIDRYGLEHWMRGRYDTGKVFEDSHQVDIVEDFIHLLIVILSDRASLITMEDEPEPLLAAARRELIHTLCFKPLSFSDLNTKLNEKVQDYHGLHKVLDELTTFHAPEGLTDFGTFELKPEYLEELDPFNAVYNRTQREEAENIYKKWMSQKLGKPAEEIVLQPRLRSIPSGVFSDLTSFTRTPLFAQIIYSTLSFAIVDKTVAPDVPAMRIESLLLVLLQLASIAAADDETPDDGPVDESTQSFIYHALFTGVLVQYQGHSTIVEGLRCISGMDEYASCRPKINNLLMLLYRKRSHDFSRATAHLDLPYGRSNTASPASEDQDAGAKKKHALERKAKVMAQFQQQQQNFMDNHGMSEWANDDVSDIEVEASNPSQKGIWKYPVGACILCQEETNDGRVLGTFGMFTRSNLLRQTNLDDADWVREALCTPSDLDHSITHSRPFGIAGDNHEQIVRLTATGDSISTDRQGLGKGWPAGFTKNSPLSTGCGHLMHYACFEPYFQSVVKRHRQQVARHHPERTENYEFVCPLCKALGNAFLPILWKEKEISYPGVLAKEHTLEGFLCNESDRIFTSQQGLEHNNLSGARTDQSSWGSIRVKFSDAILKAVSFSRSMGSSSSPSMPELSLVFSRLRDTIYANRLNRVRLSPSSTYLVSTVDTLLSLLSSSVSAVEIGQRGVGADPGSSLLEKTSMQTLSHLHVFSETIASFISIGELSGDSLNHDLSLIQKRLFQQFFSACDPGVDRGNEKTPLMSGDLCAHPLLLQDVFDVFVQSCFVLRPTLDIDIHHLLHLCYLAHILQIVLAYMFNQKGLISLLENPGSQQAHFPSPASPTSSEVHALSRLSGWINNQLVAGGYAPAPLPAGSESVIYALVRSHSLTFLRKAVVFLHVSNGVDFSSPIADYSAPEINRLSTSLQLPSLGEAMAGLEPHSGNISTQNILAGWVRSATRHESEIQGEGDLIRSSPKASPTNVFRNMSLHHPAPFGLIGLPKHFDVLMEEANRRRCPTTGRELTDPALCLFCGTILCIQAYCCMKNKSLGPANLHVEKCSSPIGVFLSIRKCTVLILHVVAKPPPLPSSSSSSSSSSQHNPTIASGPSRPANGPQHRSTSPTSTTTTAAAARPPSQPAANPHLASTSTSLGSFTSSGSWLHAPYLTRHGEVDPGLRQRHQLVLSQKRYDRLLRDVWLMLNGDLWSAVARKLEGEINGGGWESI